MIDILVTGGKGQLGQSIESLDHVHGYRFIYKDALELDITDKHGLTKFFHEFKIDWCINCAAYTAVDKAESEIEIATKINTKGPEILAQACNEFHIKLIHVSTDFVFDGHANTPYNESSPTHPLSVYGATKLDGERRIMSNLETYFILRTSWLYSEFGNNFLKTMLKLSIDKFEINVVVDQIGTPTYAKDLALAIVEIIKADSRNYGVYNYSNQGVASWYDFAIAIFEIADLSTKVNPISTDQYPTPALRPNYSVLDKSKAISTFNFQIPYWRKSLQQAISSCKLSEQKSEFS